MNEASATLTRFKCAYCGATQTWTGEGAPVCKQCGATQPALDAAPAVAPPEPRSVARFILPGVLMLALVGGLLFSLYRQMARPVAPPVVAAATAPAAKAPAPPVTGSRIQRVENPHVRVIPKGLDLSVQDLLDSAHSPPAPAFDAQRLLTIKTPRRITDENHNHGYLGEVTNTSPDQVAIAPQATLILTKNGKEIDRASHDFPDLVPGQHVPVYFGYDGGPKAFDAMTFVWRPTQSYTVGAAGYGQVMATVESKSLEQGETLLNGDQLFRYTYLKVTGTIRNAGPGKANGIRLFVVARDAKGEMTGYERQDSGGLDSGASSKFEVKVVQWGDPAVTVEAMASPTSPPPL